MRFTISAVVVVLAVSGCGGGQADDSSTKPGSAAAGAGGSTGGMGSGGMAGGGASGGSGAGSGGAPTNALHVDRGFLRDDRGRAVILRGVNLAGSHKYAPYFGFQKQDDYKRLKDAWGFNGIRFLAIWAALEPQKGQIDTAYLDAVAERMQWAKDAGLTVVIDMHQDVYGEGFQGDGAARWTCDESLYASYKPMSSWFLDYVTPEVTACFDRFWASDELQSHYAEAARRLAERLADNDAVIGIDPMNEPFWGSAALDTFEPQLLEPFYAKVVSAVRTAAPSWIAFLEPASTRNLGLPSHLAPFSLPEVAYAPHSYEVSAEMGTAFVAEGRPHVIPKVAKLAADATGLGAALWVGEYGGVSTLPGIDLYMNAEYDAIGAVAGSSMYWSYDEGGGYSFLDASGNEIPVMMASLVRPYPERVAGDPVEYGYDQATGDFHVSFHPDLTISAPTELVLPDRLYGDGATIDCGGCMVERAAGRARLLTPPSGDPALVVVHR